MSRRIDIPHAVPFLEEFTEKHRGQRVTLQVLEGTRPPVQAVQTEGLRLVGLDLDRKGREALSVQVMLGDGASRHLTHTLPRLSGFVLEVGADGEDERLTIESDTGERVVLLLM